MGDHPCKCGQPSTRGDGRRRYCELCWQRMMDNRCQTSVPDDGMGITFHRCNHAATVTENGKRYCRQHAPSIIKARQAARGALWKADRERSHHWTQLQTRRNELREYMVGQYRELYRVDPQVAALDAVEAELKELEA